MTRVLRLVAAAVSDNVWDGHFENSLVWVFWFHVFDRRLDLGSCLIIVSVLLSNFDFIVEKVF